VSLVRTDRLDPDGAMVVMADPKRHNALTTDMVEPGRSGEGCILLNRIGAKGDQPHRSRG
jgi:hypothetical protein